MPADIFPSFSLHCGSYRYIVRGDVENVRLGGMRRDDDDGVIARAARGDQKRENDKTRRHSYLREPEACHRQECNTLAIQRSPSTPAVKLAPFSTQ